MATPIKFQAEVSRVIRHSADVATYEFRYLDRRPRYKPGQFLHLALDPYDPTGHWPDSRCFTIAAGAKLSRDLRLTIAAKGGYTHRILNEVDVGQTLWMKGPYGDFVVQTATDQETVLVAGGTGITPFVAFMEDALAAGIAGAVWLHYAARTPELLVFRPLADACSVQLSNFRVQHYAEYGQTDGVHSGRPDLLEIAGLLHHHKTATYYLCGPRKMVTYCCNTLVADMGVPCTQIKTDHWQ